MRRSLLLLSLLALFVVLAACDRGVTPGAVEPNAITYALDELNASGINGTVTFEEVSETETMVTIAVEGTAAGATYPAHIHEGSHPGGAIYISLTPVSGDTGTSSTLVTQTDDGMNVNFDYLVNYDGYVNVHNPDDPSILVATGETGAGANDIQIEPAGN